MRLGILLGLVLVLLTACDQQEPHSEAGGKVYPSTAYLQYFGEPPQVQEGYAYAQVGYLPLNDGSGMVKPLPLFMFKEDRHLDRILSQLFSAKLIFSPRSKLSQPFAQGVRLTQLDQAGDTLIVYLTIVDSGQGIDLAGIERAITETATQFEGISRVRILYDGEPAKAQPLGGYQSRPEMIASVEPPLLVDVIGTWEPGEKQPKEILVNFDRPVAVNSFRLLNRAGEQIDGKYFTSMFNMAVVVHPEQPENFTEGMVLNVAWDVIDQLGRRNSALDTLNLSRGQH